MKEKLKEERSTFRLVIFILLLQIDYIGRHTAVSACLGQLCYTSICTIKVANYLLCKNIGFFHHLKRYDQNSMFGAKALRGEISRSLVESISVYTF